MPMPNWNQPFLPPGIQIPTQYSRPAPILQHQWPKGLASHQQPLILPQVSHGTNQQVHPIRNSNPPVFLPAPPMTYAKVANPSFNVGARSTYPPTMYNSGNYHRNQEAQIRADISS